MLQILFGILGLGSFLLSGSASSAALRLPPGFAISMVADQLTGPTALEFAPDGRLFVSLKEGQLRVVKNGVLLSQPFLSVDTDTAGEHGLVGIAFDPNFSKNSFVYVYYVAKTPYIHSRVSRFTAKGDVAIPGSEKVIVDLDDRGKSIFHVSGAIHFGLDGKLYIASGDNAGYPSSDNSQLLTNSLGKMLRLNADGSIPQDNPFYSSSNPVTQMIWSYGLRNPFSFSVQAGSGKILINDVGQSSWEEINEGSPGANFGWPKAEGMSQDPKYVNPLFTYAHGPYGSDTLGCGITGGTFYNPIIPQFPNEYVGKYFFLDYCNNWIHVLDPITGAVSSFGQDVGSSVVGMATAPDGSIYFMSEWTNSVFRLSFTGSPSPSIITQPQDQRVAVGSSATFSVNASGSQPLTYQWQRNGTNLPSATQPNYTLPVVSLEDNQAQFRCVIQNSYGTLTSSSASLTVINATPPQASIDYPVEGMIYQAGDSVYFGGAARDANDGNLPSSSYQWDVYFHHDSHFHPFLVGVTGKSAGVFQVPTEGETSSNVWYRIVMTVTNSVGLSTSVTRLIYPQKQYFTIKTSPPGLQVNVDGQPITTPRTISSVVGFNHNLSAVSPQTINGVQYEFGSWTDGLEATHDIRASISRKTYTAVFHPVGSTRIGSLTATPNPAVVCDQTQSGSTTLKWSTSGTQLVEIRINAPNGNLLVQSSASSGSITTQKWIGDGSTFYLQDVSGGLPLTADNTLATVTVNLTNFGCNLIESLDLGSKSSPPLREEF